MSSAGFLAPPPARGGPPALAVRVAQPRARVPTKAEAIAVLGLSPADVTWLEDNLTTEVHPVPDPGGKAILCCHRHIRVLVTGAEDLLDYSEVVQDPARFAHITSDAVHPSEWCTERLRDYWSTMNGITPGLVPAKIVDCRAFNDAEWTRQPLEHFGCHPEQLKSLVQACPRTLLVSLAHTLQCCVTHRRPQLTLNFMDDNGMGQAMSYYTLFRACATRMGMAVQAGARF